MVSREVRFRDIRLGVAADLLLDGSGRRVIGIDVRCGDGAHRFLPLAVSEIADGHVAVGSPLALVSAGLGFYHERARSLAALRGAPVRHGDELVGELVDVVFAESGEVQALTVAGPGGPAELRLEPALAVEGRALRRAV